MAFSHVVSILVAMLRRSGLVSIAPVEVGAMLIVSPKTLSSATRFIDAIILLFFSKLYFKLDSHFAAPFWLLPSASAVRSTDAHGQFIFFFFVRKVSKKTYVEKV